MIESGLEAEGAFFQLALLLIAHSHIVKKLKCNELISATARKVDHVGHAVSLLQEKKGVVELISPKISHGALVELAQNHGYFIYDK